ncbi:unnamed protein product [Absidia cylindrospora]
MMTIESDTKDIPYVWVDAICVDQQNPVRRKETIYQMSNIYDKASYILAIPDLHMTYLKGVSTTNYDTISASKEYYKELYHLLHGNTATFAALDEDFLNKSSITKDAPELKQLLLEHTDQFGPSLTTYEQHDRKYCPVLALDHICQTAPTHRTGHWKDWIKSSNKSIGNLHHQCHETLCPLALRVVQKEALDFDAEHQLNVSKWKSRMMKRSSSIRRSMELMTDLVVDWSSRVWVISEFSIAKRKNNLKYWFTQLSFTDDDDDDDMVDYFMAKGLYFFNLDFDAKPMDAPYFADHVVSRTTRSHSTNPVYIRFHYTMARHLSQQTFLEMMLGSKASRNEDRFYSVLPLSNYHEKKIEVSHWNIHSMLSVKLKLYDIMNNKDKVFLLFWSTGLDVLRNNVLPTFATTTLPPFSPSTIFYTFLTTHRFAMLTWTIHVPSCYIITRTTTRAGPSYGSNQKNIMSSTLTSIISIQSHVPSVCHVVNALVSPRLLLFVWWLFLLIERVTSGHTTIDMKTESISLFWLDVLSQINGLSSLILTTTINARTRIVV